MDQLQIDNSLDYGALKKTTTISPNSVGEITNAPRSEDNGIAATLFVNAGLLIDGGEYNLATNLLREILTINPNSIKATARLIECLIHTENFSEAEACCRQLLRRKPTGMNYKTYADLLYRRGDDDEARLAYMHAMNALVDDPSQLFEIYKNLGNIAVRFGDFEGAEEYYNKAYTINSSSDVLFVNYGTLAIQQEDYEKAKERFSRALDLNRCSDKAWVGLALIHDQTGDSELARANLQCAIDSNPQNSTALQLLVRMSFKDHNFSAVTEAIQVYLGLAGPDSEMSLLLAKILVVQRKESLALLELERVLLWEPRHEEALQLYNQLRQQFRA